MKKDSQPAHRWCTGQWTIPCPVCTELSDGTPGQSAQRGPQWALSGCSTELSGVHQTVWVTVGSNGGCYRLQRLADVAGTEQWAMLVWCAPDCPVHPSTESCCFCPTTIFEGGCYKYPQPAISRCGNTSNIPRHSIDISKCSYTQVLNRITWCIA
jgi:hypothetical protein